MLLLRGFRHEKNHAPYMAHGSLTREGASAPVVGLALPLSPAGKEGGGRMG